MIDLNSAQNALKDAYLMAACNQLNTNTNPLFAKSSNLLATFTENKLLKLLPSE